MIKIITKMIVKNKSPQELFQWIQELNQTRYVQWNPMDHRRYEVIKKTDNFVGSIFYLEEVISGFRISCRWKLVELNQCLPFFIEGKIKALIVYPVVLYLSARKLNGASEVTHMLQVGFSLKIVGSVLDWLITKFLLNKKVMSALKDHAVMELKNLEIIS